MRRPSSAATFVEELRDAECASRFATNGERVARSIRGALSAHSARRVTSAHDPAAPQAARAACASTNPITSTASHPPAYARAMLACDATACTPRDEPPADSRMVMKDSRMSAAKTASHR